MADMVAGRQPAVLEALWRDGAVPWVKHPFGHWSMDWIRRTVSPVRRSLPLRPCPPAARKRALPLMSALFLMSALSLMSAPALHGILLRRAITATATAVCDFADRPVAGWIDCTDHCLVGGACWSCHACSAGIVENSILLASIKKRAP